MSYYWLGFYRLEPNSIVKAGNWGRILSITNFNANPFILSRELLLENVRLQYYPERPSRMKSIFLGQTPELLIEFRNQTMRIADLIHEVELVNPELPTFESNWHFFGMSDKYNLIQNIELARQYWEGQISDFKEIVSLSDIRIIRCLE